METPDFGATIRVPSPGQKVFQRYTLKKILGRGGMGIVWLAHDDKLDREVALKFLPEVVVHDPKAIDELKREARRNLDLTHPHIVRIYDFVDDAQGAAIAMEYVEGHSLSKHSLTQPGGFFLLHQVRPWVEQLCAALTYAHEEAKVVHRDLKPANLMLDGRERIKITDFGIARSIADSVSRVSAMAGSAGTPMYMSPQQMMGEQPAVTDDIYSLGATLYELLTGKPPFHSGDIIAQVQGKVPPTINERRRELGFNDQQRPDVAVTREWEETIAACLAKDRAARPQSAFEIADRLGLQVPSTMGTRSKTAQSGLGSPQIEAPEEKLKAKVGFYSLIAAGILVVAGLGWYFGTQRSEPEFLPSTTPTPARTTPVEPKRTFSPAGNPSSSPAAESHGSMIVKTDPSGAEVTVGALERGTSPLTIKDAKPGRYPVRVKLAGYEEWSGEAVIQANEYTTVDAALVRSTGQVIIRGSPSGAEVSDGSRLLGTLPLTLDRVPTGDVHYAVRAKGYSTAELSGTVARNSELKLSASLEKVKMPETGQRWVISDLNLEMIPIAAGSFVLGSTKGDTDEVPVVQVTLSQPFWMGKTEVTQAQWTAVMGKNPSNFKKPDQPVEQVSWNNAMDFCKKLTERERLAGRLPEGYTFTLPTEAQWEYTCRAGTTEAYAGSLDALGWYSGNSGNTAHPVAQKQANPWGLYDMHGSVWEWCLDWYGPYHAGSVTDPKGASSGTRRVVRGGSWNSQSSRSRSSVRDGWDPRQSGNNLGFRVSLIQTPLP